MATFKEIMQDYVNRSYDELLRTCKSNISDLTSIFSRYLDGDQDKTVMAVLIVFGACIGADGTVSAKEARFFNDLLNSNKSTSEIVEMVKTFGDREAVELLDEMADSMTVSEKATLLSACTCFLAVDETINAKEIAFLAKLIEQ